MPTRAGWGVLVAGVALVAAGRLVGGIEFYVPGAAAIAAVAGALLVRRIRPSQIAIAKRLSPPRVPAGEGYCAIESANGELGFYLVSDGSGVPVKVRCRPPSLINLAPLPLMVRGSLLADIIPTFDFVNMIGGECDR